MDTDRPAQLAERVAMARAVATALLATLPLPAGATAQTTAAMSRGWVTSHVDVVDQFSPGGPSFSLVVIIPIAPF